MHTIQKAPAKRANKKLPAFVLVLSLVALNWLGGASQLSQHPMHAISSQPGVVFQVADGGGIISPPPPSSH